MRRVVPGLLLIGLLAAAPTEAATLNAVDSGWYTSAGSHTAVNDNYVVGELSGVVYRNFFVFDLTGVSETITSASVLLYNPTNTTPGLRGYISPDPTETFGLFDVSTPIATLSASSASGSAVGIGVFADLGTGVAFGEQVVSAADNGAVVSVALNASGIAALNAARGGLFDLGGALTTLGSVEDERVFGFSVALGNPDVRQLQFETAAVPEPSTLALLASAMVLAVRRRSRG